MPAEVHRREADPEYLSGDRIRGGVLLATTGAQAWTGTEDNWLGGSATMWWSHADATTYRAWINESGLDIDSEHFVPEAGSGHQLFWARRPGDSSTST